MSSLEKRIVKLNTQCSNEKVIVAINNAYLSGMYKLCAELLSAYGY